MSCFLDRRSVIIASVSATLLTSCALLPALNIPTSESAGRQPVAARRESVVHFFTGPPDGGWPDVGRLVFDKAGNLYGATYIGGSGNWKFRRATHGCGTIFELSPRRHGGWTERVIYSFKTLADGAAPYSTLTLDSMGHIYGVTMGGGVVLPTPDTERMACLPAWRESCRGPTVASAASSRCRSSNRS
jgi:hypothetical protein